MVQNSVFSLQLNSSAILGPAVGLLGLPKRGARPLRAGTRCRVAGWGSVSNFEEVPPGLMEAEVRVLDLNICNISWKGHLRPAMVCTHSGDRRRRGFCSVRYSFSVPPTDHMGNQGPQGTVRAGKSLGNSIPTYLWPDGPHLEPRVTRLPHMAVQVGQCTELHLRVFLSSSQ